MNGNANGLTKEQTVEETKECFSNTVTSTSPTGPTLRLLELLGASQSLAPRKEDRFN